MKAFQVIQLCAAILISCDATEYKNPTALRRDQRVLDGEANPFDYSASPLPTASSKCGLINALVNETSTTPAEQAWLKETDIPERITRYAMDAYDHVFVCGNACGKPLSDPSMLLYRSMGCTKVSTEGLVNPDVIAWHNRTADDTITHTLNDRIFDALEHTMDNLPASIEGIDLLATCEILHKQLVFVTTEYEERLDEALTHSEARMKAEIKTNGYILNAISHWSNNSFVGTYVH